jgi:hypothetical protein
MSKSFPLHSSPGRGGASLSRRGLLARGGGLALGGLLAGATGTRAAQPQDPWTYIRRMDPTPELGQAPGQPASDFERIEIEDRRWDAYLQTPVKEGQDFHYTCEFDSSWIVLKAHGFDLDLDDQLDIVGVDETIEPYYTETSDGVLIWGGDIAEHYSGNYDTNFLARAKGSAMRKVFEEMDLSVTPVHDRHGIAKALRAGEHVWFKSTVDFLLWTPATWITPDGEEHPVVLSNDHALVVLGFNDEHVVIRDPLGPTTTNTERPYQYRVRWSRFLDVFAAQGNDGLAVGPARD